MTQATSDHDHDHDHDHHHGPWGVLREFFVPHSHDTADAIDDALEASQEGIRTVKRSLAALGATASAQLVIAVLSSSVGLFADTVHNFSDALTALPLWVAFILGRRKPTARYTYGLGRAEDLAGLFIVAMIAISAVVTAWESVVRLADPQPLRHLPWVAAAGLVGFAGNELVAVYRIRTGRRIGSASLVADGIHARADGFTSLAVVVGVIGVALGFRQADALVGILISIAIGALLVGTVRDIGARLLDAVDPHLVARAETALAGVAGVREVETVRLRWIGHRLHLRGVLGVDPATSAADASAIAGLAAAAVRQAVPRVSDADLSATASSAAG